MPNKKDVVVSFKLKDKDDLGSFRWKDRDDVFHNPECMETRHIFFTLRMIWNHSAPKEMVIKPYKKYVFDDYYTKDYMIEAVKHLSYELSKRSDLSPYFVKCLLIIKNHLNKNYD